MFRGPGVRMGIFSKIFGNTDEAPPAEGGQSEAGKDDRDTSPPVRAPSRPEQFAKHNTSAAEASSDGANAAPKNARAARGADTKGTQAVSAERPSPPDP